MLAKNFNNVDDWLYTKIYHGQIQVIHGSKFVVTCSFMGNGLLSVTIAATLLLSLLCFKKNYRIVYKTHSSSDNNCSFIVAFPKCGCVDNFEETKYLKINVCTQSIITRSRTR